ncbi:DUF1259 domain-containing protein [Cytobacillus dafuensis]|uniref:DUF1259 domain-containing protein n=2 Tax=Cytobacillus dafuensis TaxID=1742359 RepID=A0A5B8ZAC3_CYTDA|nr:DUF1259 domain-containing protein [Cytobacillus dafuensis]
MMNFQNLCQQCAQILNGKASVKNGICSIEITRNLQVTIQGRPSRGELHAGITFESMDYEGNALNLGEVVLLEEELTPFVNVLVRNRLIVSAIHNHWVFTKPNILYVHFQSVEPPLAFAQKVSQAFMGLNN